MFDTDINETLEMKWDDDQGWENNIWIIIIWERCHQRDYRTTQFQEAGQELVELRPACKEAKKTG